MCIIIVNEDGLDIGSDMLVKSETINPDGLGVTWLDTYETEYSLSSDWHKLQCGRPYIAHFRFATVGAVSLENNHPFEIGDTGCMLYQNGTVDNLGSLQQTDTEHMARILSDTPFEHWEHILEMTDCRWVIVDTINKSHTLYNEFSFITHKGVDYSKQNVIDSEIVAVYGTLKQGFGNHSVMGNSKLIDSGVTLNEYPMEEHGIPFVLPYKGKGGNIAVEVYMVDKHQMSSIDSLEGHPSNYVRKKTPILLENGVTIIAWLYFYPHSEYDPNKEYITEYTRGYSPNLWSSPAEDDLMSWHDMGMNGPNTLDPNHDYTLDECMCDKCGFTDTIWDDFSEQLWCYTCDNYTNSKEIIIDPQDGAKPF